MVREMIVFSSIAAGVSVFLLIFIIFVRRSSTRYQVRNRVQGLQIIDIMQQGGDTKTGRQQQRNSLRNSLLRIWSWIMALVGNRVKAMTPQALYKALDQRITWAGKQYLWNAGTFFFVMVLCGVGLVVLSLGFIFTDRLPLMQRLMIVLVLFFGGMFLPWFCLSVMITKRRQGITAQLSDMMDLVCVSVQAGLSFDAALTQVGERMKGPMADETNRMLRDIRMGMTRRQSLTAMASRCHVDSVYLFVAAVIQTESLGVSLANMLKIQADNMRDRHRQMIREKAMKLPVKLVFPLAFFIFPTIFIVVLGPLVLTVLTQLKGNF
jgi:tight adherence protein C